MNVQLKINDIEEELQGLLDIDKKSWYKIYQLMSLVETEQLYVTNYPSYTAWVRHLASTTHTHESILWTRLKAGRTYQRYTDRYRQANQDTTNSAAEHLDDQDVRLEKISPETLVLVDKIAGKNDDIADQLIPQVLAGDLTRQDLRQAWVAVRHNRSASGKTPVRKSRHDADTVDTTADTITAADIIAALSQPTWLLSNSFPADSDNKYHMWQYRMWQEFAVQTGDTRYARRIDALIAETISTQSSNYQLHLHAVEIKVSKSDLQNDQKMSEYADYADYFWIAVPSSLVNDALQIALPCWGILSAGTEPQKSLLSSNQLTIVRMAQLLPGTLRMDTITTALIKSL